MTETDIDRLKKMLLAAEGNPEGAPSEDWKPDGSRWTRTKEDLFVEVRNGFPLGRKKAWVPPYARCYNWKTKGVLFDAPAPTILEAMEIADRWIETGEVPADSKNFVHPS